MYRCSGKKRNQINLCFPKYLKSSSRLLSWIIAWRSWGDSHNNWFSMKPYVGLDRSSIVRKTTRPEIWSEIIPHIPSFYFDRSTLAVCALGIDYLTPPQKWLEEEGEGFSLIQAFEHLYSYEPSQVEGQTYFVLFFDFTLGLAAVMVYRVIQTQNQWYQYVNVLIFRRNEPAEYNTFNFEKIRFIKQTLNRLACI